MVFSIYNVAVLLAVFVYVDHRSEQRKLVGGATMPIKAMQIMPEILPVVQSIEAVVQHETDGRCHVVYTINGEESISCAQETQRHEHLTAQCIIKLRDKINFSISRGLDALNLCVYGKRVRSESRGDPYRFNTPPSRVRFQGIRSWGA